LFISVAVSVSNLFGQWQQRCHWICQVDSSFFDDQIERKGHMSGPSCGLKKMGKKKNRFCKCFLFHALGEAISWHSLGLRAKSWLKVHLAALKWVPHSPGLARLRFWRVASEGQMRDPVLPCILAVFEIIFP
jgi:hypothetical protein